jgi:2-amino-4-hydroxy-6-hydroxymethyldihydropteridine diphosphokinase
MEAWIGLGSNLGEPEARLREAIRRLEESVSIELKRCSAFYRTAPWGKENQDEFLNAVLVIDTILQPQQLLRALLDIEQQMGRERSGERWGPRCIDLDLLTYEDLVLKSPSLELPHPRMQLRAFVLHPVLELDPDFYIPGIGPAQACLAGLESQAVERVGPAGPISRRE